MPDWNQYLVLDDTKEYRKRLIHRFAEIINGEIAESINTGKMNTDRLNGMLTIMKETIKFPSTLTKDRKIRDALSTQEELELAEITTQLMRKVLE